MPDFEWALTIALNSFFEREGISAIAYRLKQSRFSSQLMDILVDSRDHEYYLAVECKSLDARKARAIYFSQHFNSAGGSHQIDRETDFITRSGRTGILAVELRNGVGKPRTAHLVPWGFLYEIFKSGRRGITLNEIVANPPLDRKGGAYQISALDIVRISGYQEMYPDIDIEDPLDDAVDVGAEEDRGEGRRGGQKRMPKEVIEG